MATPSDAVVEARYPSDLVWLLIGFSVVICCLGMWGASPFVVRQNIPLGLAMSTGGIAGVFGGRYWLRHRPVMLRFKPEGLEVVYMKTTFKWSDFETVDVVDGGYIFVCVRLRPESKQRYAVNFDGLVARSMRKNYGQYDIFLGGMRIDMTTDRLYAEIEKHRKQVAH